MYRRALSPSALALVGWSLFCFFAAEARAEKACVWKVTAPNGKIAYIGGSVHALQKSDYPLPPAFMRAFDASSRIAFEVDARALKESSESLVKEGKYRKGDSLKNHVDPRTYAYMTRLFELMNVPEESLAEWRRLHRPFHSAIDSAKPSPPT